MTLEKFVLGNIEGDYSNRYTLIADQPSPTKSIQSTSMYVLETRNQPMPSKALPKTTEPNVYYLDSIPADEQPIKKRNRQTKFPVEEQIQSGAPTVFLAPKVMPQAILYTLPNARPTPMADPSISANQQSPVATIYSLVSRQRPSTVDISANSSEMPDQISNKSPTLYSLASSSNPKRRIEEPTDQYSRPSPNIYSIVDRPARTSRGIQVDLPDSNGPAPILYTIVGDTPIEKYRPKENSSPRIITNSSTDAAMATARNDRNIIRAEQQYPSSKPTIYALIGESNTVTKPQPKPPAAKQTPPAIIITDRTNRSFERKPDMIHDEPVSYPIIKTKQEPLLKERTYPKSEALVVPVIDEPIRARPPMSQPSALLYTGSENVQSKSNASIQNEPLQLPDYRSPYAYRTQKPYRGRNSNNNPLPVISNSRSETKPRQPIYETRPHLDRRQPSAAVKPKSLERYPVNKSARSGAWDNGYQTQTDDDEEYEQRTNKNKRQYKKAQLRAPWIPVW
ncbi:unnamed protein product [Rotaria magnacalcarata]|uniref:Uncharacterized protein n=1 Tax=Rotaria magnacalcarata TaxID=392030 RepID=A0A815J2V6_9BILA|nr:unnamed protein product [Rotaria magnacalcarata]